MKRAFCPPAEFAGQAMVPPTMISSDFYQKAIKGRIAKVHFNDFKHTTENPLPNRKVRDFMTLGPFVLETDGAFETEYLYERHKVLDHDYLASCGGEKNIAPYDTQSVRNEYWGEEFLRWKLDYFAEDIAFRYDGQNTANAAFVTEQRNLVDYAAVYVECDEESDAIISYESSGSYLYLNGELIDRRPYGRVKGLHRLGSQVAVTFQKGLNLLLFKVRVGYIADGLDHRLQECLIYPVTARSGSIGITQPFPTLAYFGTMEAPRQVFPAFVGAFGKSAGAKIESSVNGRIEEITIPAMEAGKCDIVRFSVPVGSEEEQAGLHISVSEEGSAPVACDIPVSTLPYTGIDGTEHMFSDFHFDTTYHQEQRVYALGAIHITKSMIEELERDPNFKAILSEVDYLHPFYSIYPDQREALKKAFVEGRAEADCFYNQPNDLTSSGEGIVRNLVYGQIYHRDVLGRKCYVYSPGDVFGHHNQMSQICKKGGCTSAKWGKHVLGLDQVSHIVSPDGTELIHHKGSGLADAKRHGVRHYDHIAELPGNPETYPNQGDTSWMKDTLNGAQFSIFSELMDGIIADEKEQFEQTGESKLETTARDLTPHHAGVLLTRTDYKQANRLGENLLITAEKFSAIAAYYGAEYPEKALDKAWRQLICAQHHDSVTGTNNEVSFVDLMIEYREVVEIAADVINRAIAFLASGVRLSQNELPVFVFNPHTWERKDQCRVQLPLYAKEGYAIFDAAGNQYPFTVTREGSNALTAVFVPSAPAFGFEVYYLKKSAQQPKKEATNDSTIENEYFRLTVDATQGGGIVSLYDKTNQKEVVNTKKDGPANRVVILKEVPDRCETQHEFYTTGMKMFSSDYRAKVLCEKTDTYEKLTVYVRMDIVAKIKQEITLYKGVERIDMNTTIEDYQDRDDLFTLTFPVNVGGGYPVYEDRFAPHVCGTGVDKLSFQTHQYYMYSSCQVAPAVNWIDLGPTVRLRLDAGNDINIGMTAIIRADNSALRAPTDVLLYALAKKAIPVTPYDDVEQHKGGKIIHFNEDMRNTDTRFVLSVEGIANAYEPKVLELAGEANAKAFGDRLANNGCAAIFVRDSDNYYEKPIDTLLVKAKDIAALQAWVDSVADMLNTGKAVALDNVTVCEDVGHVEEYGVSILNKGTISCSVEPDNLMNMMLFHTAEMYGNLGKVTGGKELIPEQKTHSFDYALYPHAGDYRDAKVFRRGMEFNDDLIAKAGAETSDKAFLPEQASFVKTEGDFVVTALKAGGYPLAAMRADYGAITQRGFAVRGFEPNGVTENAGFRFAMPIGKVAAVDLLEESPVNVAAEGFGFDACVGAHSIETFTIAVPEAAQKIGNAKIGIEKEPVEPTFIRSWEHDLGSLPVGYFSAIASISKDVERIDDVTYRFKITVANNHPDKAIAGELELSASEGFKLERTMLSYSVAQEGMQVIPVSVTKPEKDATGILRLVFPYDGQVFEDIYEFGYFYPQTELRIEDDKIFATVINHTAERLTGELSIATPYETWDVSGFNTAARGNVYPRTCKVDVAAGERKNYEFGLEFFSDDEIINAFWAVTKLMVNGRIFFGYDRKKGPRHNQWTHQFRHEIAKDNNSLRKIFALKEV
ncbi:MAG: hypothetical protein LBS36_13720 [Oscillospiraceae bacterium]|nr:hypothetical protein [Oscillospiraceae bacterium]